MTASLPNGAGRPAESTNRIVDDLRNQIVAGELTPGERMPTRVEIENRFGAGAATVQRALEKLRKEGFVQVNGKQGTFVALNPPHLTRYAIAFPSLPSERAWSRFWTVLSNQVIAIEHSRSRPEELRLPIYHGIGRRTDSPDYLQLEQEVRSHCVAGIIFMSSPYEVAGTPLLEETGIPRVAITGPGDAGMPVVQLDGQLFQKKALDYFQSKCRRRVAVIGPSFTQEWKEDWYQALAARDMEMRPYWFHWLQQQIADEGRNIAHLLFHEGQSVRPDALLIADDNLVDHVLTGLMAAGVRVPEDVEVIAHCNFPWHQPSVMRVRRLGFDARQIIRACIASIDAQRRGEDVPMSTTIPALFESELDPETVL